MLSNKDIRIEGGDIIINGNKYPIVQDVSELEGEVNALSETVGDATSGLVKDINDIEQNLGLLRGSETILGINDVVVKSILTDSPNGVVKICMINPITSGDDTPFQGHAYVLISAKYSNNLGMQYALSLAETANKKRLYTGTWTTWA